MKPIWLVLLFVTMGAGFLPVIRFRKTIFYKFFLTVALIDPFIVAITYLFHIRSYSFLPFISAVILFALPAKSKKNILISIFSAIILIPVFNEHNWIPLLISAMNSLFIIYFFSEKIMEEYSANSAIPFFLPVLWLDSLKDLVKIYLFYRHLNLFIQLYVVFQIIGLLNPLLIAYLGFEKKYIFRKHIKVNHLPLVETPIVENESVKNDNKMKMLKLLGRRELEVLELISEGVKQNEIAKRLFVLRKTVYYHVGNIKEKLNIRSTEELYLFAYQSKEEIRKLISLNKQTDKMK